MIYVIYVIMYLAAIVAANLLTAAKDTGNAVALPPAARPPLDQGGPMVNLSTGQMARQTAEFVLACWEAEQRNKFYDLPVGIRPTPAKDGRRAGMLVFVGGITVVDGNLTPILESENVD